jgi:hypothetical protein
VIPLAAFIGSELPSTTLPIVCAIPGVLFVLVTLNDLLGLADSLREPASMALFADEGTGSRIASSFGI